MGSIFGGGTTTSSQTVNNTPWAPQQPYLEAGLKSAQDIYNTNTASGPFQGQFYAPQTSMQTTAGNDASIFANNNGLPWTTQGTSAALEGAAPSYLSNASALATNGAGAGSPLTGVFNNYATGASPAVAVNPSLSGALNTAAVNGANTLNNFSNGQTQVMNEALSDPTKQLSNQAGEYMNSSPVQSAINSTNAQINQQLHEQTVPGLNREAAAGGVLNSSRAGMGEAMANENAAIATGNADSSILNNAWNTGLNTAATERNAGLTTGMYAANSGLVDNTGLAQGEQAAQTGQSEFGTNTALAAANSGVNATNATNALNANTRLAANGQLGSGVSTGINGATAAGTQAAQNLALGSSGGGLVQQGQQTADNEAQAQFQNQNQYDQNMLNNYWNIVGKPLGSTSTSTGTTTAPGTSPLSGILGLGLGAAGLFGSGGAFPGTLGAIGGLFGGGSAVNSAFDIAGNRVGG